MKTVLSPERWAATWARTDAKTWTGSMGEFAELVNAVNAERKAEWPDVAFDNARYEVHIERALRAGLAVPDAWIATISESDIRFDWVCFPLLHARMKAGAE